MGTSAIKQRIKKEADARIKEIERGAAEEVKRLDEAAKRERAKTKEREEAQTDAQATLLEQKLLAQARLEAKKALLAEREALIDKAIEHALQELGKEYEQHVTTVLHEQLAHLSGTVTVECNKCDHALVTKHAKGATVKEAPISGGVILTDSKGKRIDESIDALLDRRRNDVRQAVAEAING